MAAGTVVVTTIPADLDTAATITPAPRHVALAPVTVAGLLALRALDRRADAPGTPGAVGTPGTSGTSGAHQEQGNGENTGAPAHPRVGHHQR